MKKVKIVQEGAGADAVTVIKVKQGSLGGLLCFIPTMIGVFVLSGVVQQLSVEGMTPSLMRGVAFAALFILAWIVIGVSIIFWRAEVRIGAREVVGFSGVGRIGFTTRHQVEGGMWSRLKPIEAMWSVYVTDRSGKEFCVFDGEKTADGQRLCEEVRRRLHDICGISLDAPPRGAEESFAAEQFAKARIKVVRGAAGDVRATYRDSHVAKGVAGLVAVVAFSVCLAWLCIRKGDVPRWVGLLFVPPMILGTAPFMYCIFGRRELSLRKGEGAYFNGVGNIGITRRFRYDASTEVFKGETEYYVKGGGRLLELQIRNKGETQLQRIFAHPEEKVVEEFARILLAGKNEMTKGTNS